MGYNKGQYIAHRVGSRYTILPTFVYSKIETARDDWAVIYIDEPFPSDIRPLKLATETPLPDTAVKLGGYPREKSQIMTADKHCHVRAISFDRKLIGHDCVIHHGDSGGPLLSAESEGLILGVNTLGHRLAEELREPSKEGGVAVAAATISDFLASQAVGSRLP